MKHGGLRLDVEEKWGEAATIIDLLKAVLIEFQKETYYPFKPF